MLRTYFKALQPGLDLWKKSWSAVPLEWTATLRARLTRRFQEAADMQYQAALLFEAIDPPPRVASVHRKLVQAMRLSSADWAMDAEDARGGVSFEQFRTVVRNGYYVDRVSKRLADWQFRVRSEALRLKVQIPFKRSPIFSYSYVP